MVEVGLIAHFVMALGNPTVSASILITGMLVFSGLGALISERILPRMRALMPVIFLAIAALLIGYALFLNIALDAIGALPYLTRLAFCFLFIAPPAFLMGFPMPTAMTTLGRLGKEHLFIWAWGVNGCFSVIGAAAAPVIATNFGLGAVIEIAGVRLPSGAARLLRRNIGSAPRRSGLAGARNRAGGSDDERSTVSRPLLCGERRVGSGACGLRRRRARARGDRVAGPSSSRSAGRRATSPSPNSRTRPFPIAG